MSFDGNDPVVGEQLMMQEQKGMFSSMQGVSV
jgi:hypothetical protein